MGSSAAENGRNTQFPSDPSVAEASPKSTKIGAPEHGINRTLHLMIGGLSAGFVQWLNSAACFGCCIPSGCSFGVQGVALP